jgi:ABC-type lipoprotein release transport system permease subunit
VGLISVVSVLGVAVGTMALIVVISVMQGFDDTLVKKFMGVFSHIQVKPDPRFFEGSRQLIPGEVSRRTAWRNAREGTLREGCLANSRARNGQPARASRPRQASR